MDYFLVQYYFVVATPCLGFDRGIVYVKGRSEVVFGRRD